jgi:hypothetical protein
MSRRTLSGAGEYAQAQFVVLRGDRLLADREFVGFDSRRVFGLLTRGERDAGRFPIYVADQPAPSK